MKHQAIVVAVAAAVAGGPTSAPAQSPRDSAVHLTPLLEFGVARSAAATLADRRVSTGSYRESMRLRLGGQWGLIAEGRVPFGERKVWGVEVYGARFSGSARASAARQMQAAGAPGGTLTDSIDYRLGRVVSLRGTLGLVRAVPLPARLEGALLLGGTLGSVRGPTAACGPTSCPPAISLFTPGATGGADVMTPSIHRFRVRLALKTDLLSVDEAEVRRDFRWTAFSAAPAGEGARRWHLFPSGTLGLEYQFLF